MHTLAADPIGCTAGAATAGLLARFLRHGCARRPKAEESRPKVEELPDEIAPAAAEEPPISMADVMQMMKVPPRDYTCTEGVECIGGNA